MSALTVIAGGVGVLVLLAVGVMGGAALLYALACATRAFSDDMSDRRRGFFWGVLYGCVSTHTALWFLVFKSLLERCS